MSRKSAAVLTARLALWAALAAVLALVGVALWQCATPKVFDQRWFTYPPGSDPDRDDWTHVAVVTVSSRHSLSESGTKTVRVVIEDEVGRVLMRDRVEVEGRALWPVAAWQRFDSLSVTLLEDGFADEAAAREVRTLEYRYKEDLDRFVRQ